MEFLTVKDIGNLLGISRATAYKLVNGSLPAVRVGRTIRVRKSDFDKWTARAAATGENLL